jgi:aerobic carbon-monoxide dehydrogenase large subunit
MLERTLDVLAVELGIDALEIRRRNVLRPEDLPYLRPTGVEYDSGDYPALLDRLAAESGYENLRREQATAREHGDRLLGIGLAMVLDSTAWFARVEGAAVSVQADGTVLVRAGSASAGRQHEVAYREIVRSVLPVPRDQIEIVEGDTDRWSHSDGTMGSRTTQMAGTAILRSTQLVLDRLPALAATVLEAAIDDIVFDHGGFGVRGVPTSVYTLAELVAEADEPVEASCVYEQGGATYPSAAHLSVVEIDTETGRVVPVCHVCVTDSGRLVDPPSA